MNLEPEEGRPGAGESPSAADESPPGADERSQNPLRTRVFLVRHTVTRANSAGRRLGELDEELTDRGIEQARALVARGRELGLAAVWTSPLARARQTADVVAGELDLPVYQEPRLEEMALGPWEGLRESQIRERYPAEYEVWTTDPERLDLPGHEGLGSTQERAVSAIEDILARGDRVLCVTHLTVLRVVWAHYEQKELNAFAQVTPDHGELFAVERTDGATRCRSFSRGVS